MSNYKYVDYINNEVNKDYEVFVFIDESLKALNIKTPKNSKISYSEILFIAYDAFMNYGSNYKKALTKNISSNRCNCIDYSRFLKKLSLLQCHFSNIISQLMKQGLENKNNVILSIDSTPINITTKQRKSKKIAKDQSIHYDHIEKTYSQSIKLNVISEGKIPRFAYIDYGNNHDLNSFKNMFDSLTDKDLDLLNGSILIGDKAYISSKVEESLKNYNINYKTIKKHNDKTINLTEETKKKRVRRLIETMFGLFKNNNFILRAKSMNNFIDKLQLAFAFFTLTTFMNNNMINPDNSWN